MAGSGYQVSPALLTEAAQGINNTIGQLKTLGIAESAEVGRGFSALTLSGLQVGHDGLQGAFATFCQRWEWGVRALVQDGTETARRLGIAAGTYNDMEQYAVGALKVAVNSVIGDPHATNEQVQNESLGQMIDNDSPDFSAEAAQRAQQHISSTWQAVGDDAAATARNLVLGPQATR